MTTPQQRIRDFYGFDFPDDFFAFADFLDSLPEGLLRNSVDYAPAYPFELARGEPAEYYPENPHWEDRYYNDLPEFVSLIRGFMDGLHYGYFFDAPGSLPPVVAGYYHSDTFEHTVDGDSLFEWLRYGLERSEDEYKRMADDEPGESEYYQCTLDSITELRQRLNAVWGADRSETGWEYTEKYDESSNWRMPTAETWDRVGIYLEDEDYRELSSNPWAGWRVELDRTEVEGLIREARSLAKRGFPSVALELGRNLWVWANDYPECYDLLELAYNALGRDELIPLMNHAREFRRYCDEKRQARS